MVVFFCNQRVQFDADEPLGKRRVEQYLKGRLRVPMAPP